MTKMSTTKHTKSSSWHGWADARKSNMIHDNPERAPSTALNNNNQRHASKKCQTFGLEMQKPYSGHLLCGRKTIKTCAYHLPSAFLSDGGNDSEVRIEILESEKGLDGISSIPDWAYIQSAMKVVNASKPPHHSHGAQTKRMVHIFTLILIYIQRAVWSQPGHTFSWFQVGIWIEWDKTYVWLGCG